nr:MAG TPA: hypothetical protein [Caudoviricetes sp.]
MFGSKITKVRLISTFLITNNEKNVEYEYNTRQ